MSRVPRILFIDDEKLLLLSLGAYFEDEEFDVLMTDSGEQAITMLESEDVDVAVVDMRLPGMDGEEVIEKAHQIQPSLQFILYTGSSEYALSANLREIGMTSADVIVKPQADMAVILKAVNRLIDKRNVV